MIFIYVFIIVLVSVTAGFYIAHLISSNEISKLKEQLNTERLANLDLENVIVWFEKNTDREGFKIKLER